MRLAKEFNRDDWEEFAAAMPAQRLAEWMEFYRWEPFGKPWEQTATIAHTYATLKGAKGLKIRDFMPCPDPAREQTQEQTQIQSTITAFFGAFCAGSRATSDSDSG